jgi:hypothetical protein
MDGLVLPIVIPYPNASTIARQKINMDTMPITKEAMPILDCFCISERGMGAGMMGESIMGVSNKLYGRLFYLKMFKINVGK